MRRCTGTASHDGEHRHLDVEVNGWINLELSLKRREMRGDYHDDGLRRCSFDVDGRSPLNHHPQGDGSGAPPEGPKEGR